MVGCLVGEVVGAVGDTFLVLRIKRLLSEKGSEVHKQRWGN